MLLKNPCCIDRALLWTQCVFSRPRIIYEPMVFCSYLVTLEILYTVLVVKQNMYGENQCVASSAQSLHSIGSLEVTPKYIRHKGDKRSSECDLVWI